MAEAETHVQPLKEGRSSAPSADGNPLSLYFVVALIDWEFLQEGRYGCIPKVILLLPVRTQAKLIL